MARQTIYSSYFFYSNTTLLSVYVLPHSYIHTWAFHPRPRCLFHMLGTAELTPLRHLSLSPQAARSRAKGSAAADIYYRQAVAADLHAIQVPIAFYTESRNVTLLFLGHNAKCHSTSSLPCPPHSTHPSILIPYQRP